MASPKRDTRLEAEGAEFLICALLLIEGIPAYKTYTQMPGYDVVALDPRLGRMARIQVKSRWDAKSDEGFPMKSDEADFVAFVKLNRSSGTAKTKGQQEAPEIFIFPMDVALAARRNDGWQKVMTKKIPDREKYKNNWNLIKNFLSSNSCVQS